MESKQARTLLPLEENTNNRINFLGKKVRDRNHRKRKHGQKKNVKL